MRDPKSPKTGLAVYRPAQIAPSAGDLAGGDTPELPVQRTVPAMIEAAVSVFGDVVSALLCDLDQVTAGMERLAWLSGSRTLLHDEEVYQAALAQLQWWDAFLAELPSPLLISERDPSRLRRAKAARTRATLLAREQALADHRRLVAEELRRPDLDPDERARLLHALDDPDDDEWRVDIQAYIAEALRRLPDATPPVPIVAEDLDARYSFAGFNAVQAFRSHPELGPRAAQMDAALAEVLQREFRLSKRDALAHAQRLTGIFWIALRRALQAGTHQIAASIRFVSAGERASEDPIRRQFTEELLRSWLYYVEQLPVPAAQRSLGQRLRGLLANPEPPAIAGPERKQIAQDDRKPGLWARLWGKGHKD